MKKTFTKDHIRESIEILNKLDDKCIDNIVSSLVQIEVIMESFFPRCRRKCCKCISCQMILENH